MKADGKGKDAGAEPGGSKTAQQQADPKGLEGGQENGVGDNASSQMAGKSRNMGQGDSVEGIGDSMHEQAGQKEGNSEGSKGGTPNSSDLKNKIASQMDGLSGQISTLEKEMGMDIRDSMENGDNLKEQGDFQHKEAKNKRKELPREDKAGTNEKVTPAGDKPGEKLYSTEQEEIESPENAENMNMKIEGIQDELGALRETVSTGKGKPSRKRRKLPTVGYDDTVKRSEEQAEDDAIRNTSIPLEYEDIIKKIHSDKE